MGKDSKTPITGETSKDTPKKYDFTENKPIDPMALIERLVAAMEKSAGNKFRTNEPSTYDGTRDALVIDGWIRAVERYGDIQNWDDTQIGNYAVTLFKGRADAWYRTIEPAEDETPLGWLAIKRSLIQFFRPENSVLVARDKIAVLRQDSDLTHYINTFMDLKLAIPDMHDGEATDRFVRGLRDGRMRSHIRQYQVNSLTEAIHTALAFDAGEERRYTTMPRRTQQYVDDPMDIDAIDDVYAVNSRRRYGNNRFNNSGNFRSNNANMRNNNGNIRFNNNNSGITCYYCNKKGHVKALCPVRRMDIKALDENRQKQHKKDFH